MQTNSILHIFKLFILCINVAFYTIKTRISFSQDFVLHLLILTVMIFGISSKTSQVYEISIGSDEDISGIANNYADEYMHYLENGIESHKLKELSAKYRQSDDNGLYSRRIPQLNEVLQFGACTICRITAEIAARILRLDLNATATETVAKAAFQFVCHHLNMQTAEVCRGLFKLNWPILYYILRHSKADAQTFCGILPISFCQVKQPEFNWSVNVDASKGLLMTSKGKPPKRNSNDDLTILQLTDIHYDPEYKAGSLADCKEPLCCRSTSSGNIKSDDSKKAGYWSDYRNCDAPLHMIENALDHIREKHKDIDYIYLTGDIVPHNVWSTTRQSNKAIITDVNSLIERQFGNLQVYPVVGNHEEHPVNVFGHKHLPQQFQSDWLYNHLWSTWQQWLPGESKKTILEGGYYTVTPKPGFRIISLNNNDCYLVNWWLYYDGNVNTSLPQLQWLHDTLLSAESAGEHVHILAHIPSGASDCWTVWAREFNRIIERFSDTIGGIFNGHSHYDEMQVHYSKKGYAMMVSWNAGSLTPHTFKNPNYRVYTVEPSTYQVIDHSTWIFNLTEANEHGSRRVPNWFEEYRFTKFTNDLSPSGVDTLLHRMAETPDVLRLFWQYKMTSADPQLAQGCDYKCLLNTICSLATSVYNDKRQCEEFKAKLKQSLG